jgi:hypothetical protein
MGARVALIAPARANPIDSPQNAEQGRDFFPLFGILRGNSARL